MEKMVKTAMGFSYLVPIMVEEVLPGDTWKAHITTVARTAVPIVPLMDNWHLEYFAFFVPNRLLWTNWVKFMGEQDNPGDSISYTIPVCNPTTGYAVSSLQDYMGLITTGQNNGNPWSHSALPLRAYNQIYNAWFRDENLQNSVAKNVGDGPDSTGDYVLLKRGKRKDYFTGALPWPQKGNAAVTLPLGTTAPVNVAASIATGNSVRLNVLGTTTARQVISQNSGTGTTWGTLSAAGQAVEVFADLSTATAATINQLRQSLQIQRLLERDARGGTRYTEIIRSHFGVISPDARLQRPEYIRRQNADHHQCSPTNQFNGPHRCYYAYGNACGNRTRARRNRLHLQQHRTRIHPRPRVSPSRPHLSARLAQTVEPIHEI